MNIVLQEMLSLAVWVEVPHMARASFAFRKRLIADAPDLIGASGDVLQFGGSKERGKIAKTFAAVARGLAVLALQPGGVTFDGTKFQACPRCARPIADDPTHCTCGHDLAVGYDPEAP